MNFYKITKEEAELLGQFKCEDGSLFDPFVGEQEDGCYIITEEKYKEVSHSDQFKKIDWSKKELISEKELNPKKTEE